VLSTTSIGQEGLDFHSWCDTIVHWDLAHDPVSHEQRQGRIQRFGSHAVRRQIAKHTCVELDGRGVLWEEMARCADLQHSDQSGLKPWWIMPGASVKNVLLSVPVSDERSRFDWLREQVTLYRLALGQPNQEDLIEVLNRSASVTEVSARAASLQLSSILLSACRRQQRYRQLPMTGWQVINEQ
jgi:hypothetical protein